MTRKQRDVKRRVETIISKLQQLKEIAQENPDVDTPNGIEGFQQECVCWVAELESNP